MVYKHISIYSNRGRRIDICASKNHTHTHSPTALSRALISLWNHSLYLCIIIVDYTKCIVYKNIARNWFAGVLLLRCFWLCVCVCFCSAIVCVAAWVYREVVCKSHRGCLLSIRCCHTLGDWTGLKTDGRLARAVSSSSSAVCHNFVQSVSASRPDETSVVNSAYSTCWLLPHVLLLPSQNKYIYFLCFACRWNSRSTTRWERQFFETANRRVWSFRTNRQVHRNIHNSDS